MGQTDLLPLWRKACWGFFSPWKIRRLRSGLNPRTWVPKASTLTLDHRSRFSDTLHLTILFRTLFTVLPHLIHTTFRELAIPSSSCAWLSYWQLFYSSLALRLVAMVGTRPGLPWILEHTPTLGYGNVMLQKHSLIPKRSVYQMHLWRCTTSNKISVQTHSRQRTPPCRLLCQPLLYAQTPHTRPCLVQPYSDYTGGRIPHKQLLSSSLSHQVDFLLIYLLSSSSISKQEFL